MSIRIQAQSDVSKVESPRAVAPKSTEVETKSTGSSTAASRDDEASLSTVASLVAFAKTAVPAGRAEKLASLAASVGSGSYKVSSKEVSRSIVQSLLKK